MAFGSACQPWILAGEQSSLLTRIATAVALHYAYYNFVKPNIGIRCTRAMATGVIDTFWTVRDLVEMIEA